MKKVLLSLLVAFGIAGQAVAQEDENNEPIQGWLVVKDGVSIENSNGESTSFSDIYWERSRFFLPKGTLMSGGLEYMFFYDENGERHEPKYPDGYIYFQDEITGNCERIEKEGLKKVQLSSYIPLAYGNGKAHKAENGMSFKIVPFKSSANVKFVSQIYNASMYDTREFKRFLKSQKCYLLMIMSSTGKVEHVELLEKTSKGFKNAHHKYCYFSQNEPKVNAQGLLTSQWRMYMCDLEEGFATYWMWIKNENALVGVADIEPNQYVIPFLKVVK